MEPPIIPDRTSAIQTHQEQWETRKAQMQKSSSDLKRKISNTSFKDSPLEHTKLRIQDYEIGISAIKHDVTWWDIQLEQKKVDPKAYREGRKANYNRIISLGDLAWQQRRLLHGFQREKQGLEKLTPDYTGAFSATLLSLYKDPNISRKRKGHMPSNLRRTAIEVYDSRQGARDTKTLWCPIIKEYAPQEDVIAAHIVPYSLNRGIAEYLFGHGSGVRMDTPDNCLMIFQKLEIAMYNHQVVFLPADRDETPIKRWRIHLTTDDARGTLLYPGKTLGDLNGSELEFKNDSRPAARFLYYHFVLTIMICRERRLAGWEKNMKLLTGKPFATWGRWMRTSVLLGLARTAGDRTLEFEEALIDPNASFPDEGKLSGEEEMEVARRCLEAAVGKEEGEEGKQEGGEEEEEEEEDGEVDSASMLGDYEFSYI